MGGGDQYIEFARVFIYFIVLFYCDLLIVRFFGGGDMSHMKELFKPLGVDNIVIACCDIAFWQKRFELLGFERVVAKSGQGIVHSNGYYENYFGTAMSNGAIRIVMVDPNTARFEKGVIKSFIDKYGDMQVLSIGILVDNLAKAKAELAKKGFNGNLYTYKGGDQFGIYAYFNLGFPCHTTFHWNLVERKDTEERLKNDLSVDASFLKPACVDHFAIVCQDLKKWKEIYSALGFRVIYSPREKIAGKYSSMKTVAMQRGAWTVALVEGIDGLKQSQVSAYVRDHGDHSVQHIALGFKNLPVIFGDLSCRGIKFRHDSCGKEKPDFNAVVRRGEDYSGPMLQCFTKSLTKNGLFFELIQRIKNEEKKDKSKQAFHDPTVVSLYRLIEMEEVSGDKSLIF